MTVAKIISIDFEVAKNIVSNDDLTSILDTSDEWISSRTGIKKRHVASNDETSTDLAIGCAKKIINRAKFDPKNIDLIIASASTPEIIYPSVSCSIQEALGANNAACFDVKAACAGFIYCLSIAKAFIESNAYKNILIVASDATTKFTDWKDRSVCVLFGDGAGGALISATDNEKENSILGINLSADGSCGDYITLRTDGDSCPLADNNENYQKSAPYISMKGKDVYKFVMTKIPNELEKLMEKTGINVDKIDYFIPHQSNQRMIDALAQRLNIEDNKVISNIEHYGNMSAASIPTALREAIDEGKIKLPATIMLSAFGAGMSAGNAIIRLE